MPEFVRDMLRTRLADALAHTLATKPFELTPGEDLERRVNLAMADAVLVVVAEWFSEEAVEQWARAANHDDPRSRELATIRAMYLTDRAIELEGNEPAAESDSKAASGWYPVECEHGFDHCPKCDARSVPEEA